MVFGVSYQFAPSRSRGGFAVAVQLVMGREEFRVELLATYRAGGKVHSVRFRAKLTLDGNCNLLITHAELRWGEHRRNSTEYIEIGAAWRMTGDKRDPIAMTEENDTCR